MSNRPVVYIAGPFRAETPWKVEQNIRRMEDVALEVAKIGAVPLCPHTMYRYFDKSLPDEFWLDATVGLLLRCDAILMCGEWIRSAGSRNELEVAEAICMRDFDAFAEWSKFRKWVSDRVNGGGDKT